MNNGPRGGPRPKQKLARRLEESKANKKISMK